MKKRFLLISSMILLIAFSFSCHQTEEADKVVGNEYFEVKILSGTDDGLKVMIQPRVDTLKYYFDLTPSGTFLKYDSFSKAGFDSYMHDLISDLSKKFLLPSSEIGEILLLSGDNEYVFSDFSRDASLVFFISPFDKSMNPLSEPLSIPVPFS